MVMLHFLSSSCLLFAGFRFLDEHNVYGQEGGGVKIEINKSNLLYAVFYLVFSLELTFLLVHKLKHGN